jgi:hypothetical protein
MLTTLRLKCLIEGEDIIFPVTAVCDKEVNNLKGGLLGVDALIEGNVG